MLVTMSKLRNCKHKDPDKMNAASKRRIITQSHNERTNEEHFKKVDKDERNTRYEYIYFL